MLQKKSSRQYFIFSKAVSGILKEYNRSFYGKNGKNNAGQENQYDWLRLRSKELKLRAILSLPRCAVS
jgi:hypothetical protein